MGRKWDWKKQTEIMSVRERELVLLGPVLKIVNIFLLLRAFYG